MMRGKLVLAVLLAAALCNCGLGEVNAGDVVVFGAYEQDGDASNGAEPIQWLVLDVDADSLLVTALYGLDCKRYHCEESDIDWAHSDVRHWLNTDFMQNAITDEEARYILPSFLENAQNPSYHVPGGEDTRDRMFLLSIAEAKLYFKNATRALAPTPYAISRGGSGETSGQYRGNCPWMLRSPGEAAWKVARVHPDGLIYYRGGDADTYMVVRPACRIDASAPFLP